MLSCTATTCQLPLIKSLLGCCHTWTWLSNNALFSFSVLPASCSHQSASSESENISKEFSSPTSLRIERENFMCENPYEQLGPLEETYTYEIRSLWGREQLAYSILLQRNVFFIKYNDFYYVAEHFCLSWMVSVVFCSPVLVIWTQPWTHSVYFVDYQSVLRFLFQKWMGVAGLYSKAFWLKQVMSL